MKKLQKSGSASKAARSVKFNNECTAKGRELKKDREKYIKEVSGKALSCIAM